MIKTIILALFVLTTFVIFVLKINNKEDKKQLISKLSFVAIGIAILYAIILFIQPSSYIKYNTNFNQTNNTHINN